MKHLLILAVLTLAASLPCVEVDLSDVELSTDSAEALVSFEEAMQKESEAYLDKVSKLRDKYVKKMEYDAKRQKDIRVVMKIEATIKELQDRKPVDLFGKEIVQKLSFKSAKDLEKFLIGTKWQGSNAKQDGGDGNCVYEFKIGGIIETGFGSRKWEVSDDLTVEWGGTNKRTMTFNKDYTGFTDSHFGLIGVKITEE